MLPWSSTGANPVIFRNRDLWSLLGITIAYATLLILFVEKDGTKYLRKFKVTERTSRNSIWNDVFQSKEQGAIVQIDLADGRRLQRIVRFYSDTAEESSVFLKDARWVIDEDEDRFTPINGPGILIIKEAKFFRLAFSIPAKNNIEAQGWHTPSTAIANLAAIEEVYLHMLANDRHSILPNNLL